MFSLPSQADLLGYALSRAFVCMLLICLPLTASEGHAAHNHHRAGTPSAALTAETTYWNSVRNSPYAADLQAYLGAYPHGTFVGQAHGRLAKLQRTRLTLPVPPPAPTPDVSGRSRLWKKDVRTNCWVYDPYTEGQKLTLGDILPTFLFKPIDSEGNVQDVTIGDLLPGLLRKKLSGEADPADAMPSWSGACENQLASGSGTLTWSNKGKTLLSVSGSFSAGILNGHGVSISDGGTRYEGNFVKDVPNGHGLFQTSDGARYDGEVVNNRMSGHGVSTNATGTYDGEFLDNKQNGHGVFILANGDRIEGTWTNGLRNPESTYTFSDGARYEGEIPGEGTLTTPDGKQQFASASQDEQGAISINVGGQ